MNITKKAIENLNISIKIKLYPSNMDNFLTKINKDLPATMMAKTICIENINAKVNKIPLNLKNK